MTTFCQRYYRAHYIEPSQLTSFRASCGSTEMRAIDDTLRPFFASWTTSLIGTDLERLQSLSENQHLRSLIKSLVIEDDSPKLDPWVIAAIPSVDSTYNIWPRNEADIGIEGKIGLGVGISTLARILLKRLLQPTQITIRNYCISADNLRLCVTVRRRIKSERRFEQSYQLLQTLYLSPVLQKTWWSAATWTCSP